MFKSLGVFVLLLPLAGWEQQQPPPQEAKPNVKVNYLNVCTPSQDEQTLIREALAKVPMKPNFAADFEISRGRATVKDTASKFVRLRRDFSSDSSFMTAQYSMSTDPEATVETFVARTRDPKEFHEISIEARVSPDAASPVAIVTTDTPAERVRIERLGKPSVVLARCEGSDQSAYQALFRQASDILAEYRRALGLRGAFRSDIAWLVDRKTENEHAAQPVRK